MRRWRSQGTGLGETGATGNVDLLQTDSVPRGARGSELGGALGTCSGCLGRKGSTGRPHGPGEKLEVALQGNL